MPISLCTNERNALKDVRDQYHPLFRKILEFLAIEALLVCRQLSEIQRQVPGQHPPRAIAHAQRHAHRQVHDDLGQVMRRRNVQPLKPSATWQLVRRCHYVS